MGSRRLEEYELNFHWWRSGGAGSEEMRRGYQNGGGMLCQRELEDKTGNLITRLLGWFGGGLSGKTVNRGVIDTFVRKGREWTAGVVRFLLVP